jgi:hypothetical protein
MGDPFVGIQIGAISFIDEGVENVLDILQSRGGVNALVIGALSWSRGTAGRAILGYPDHGGQAPDELIGGAFWYPDPRCYENTIIKNFRAPDALYEGFDTLRDVIPAAHARGIKVYPYYCETPEAAIRHANLPGAAQLVEIDAYGQRTGRPCNNNPLYRGWVFGFIEDWCRNYDTDGLLWGIERQGGLKALLAGETPTCFCPWCQEIAARRNIDAGRAAEGYRALQRYLREIGEGASPRDGYLVTFLRILLSYPEVFQWEKLWLDSHRQLHRELAGVAKFQDPRKEVGFGIWQVINTFSPYLRAQYDLEEFRQYADWLKPIVYHVPAGVRFTRYLRSFQAGLFHRKEQVHVSEADEPPAPLLRDFSAPEALGLFYGLLGLDEAPLEQLPAAGLSAEYVRRETARTVAAVGERVKVCPGIGIGVPGGPGGREIEPEDVKSAIRAAFEGGARGILLSRNYSEAMLRNLDAAGDALRELRQF